MKYYNITLRGYGGESVYGKATAAQYAFWNDDEKLEELGFDDGEEALQDYMLDKEEYEDKIPEDAQFEHEWHDMDDIEHSFGVTYDSAYIDITQVDSGEWGASHVADVWEGDVTQLVTEQDIETEDDILDLDDYQDKEGHCFVFYGMSVEKGEFVHTMVELEDDVEFDIAKLNFGICEMPNGDTIVNGVMYDGEYLDNDGGDTIGKAMYMEIWDY